MKTKAVERNLYVNYVRRAEECLASAQYAFGARQWNASTISAIHAAIASLDTLCVYFLGQRHAGQTHDEVLQLCKGISHISTEDKNAIATKIIRILRMKNMAEYEERLVHSNEAEKILHDTERLIAIVKKNLPL